MRFIPNSLGGGNGRLNRGQRPADDLLPADVVKLLAERDGALERLAEARQRAAGLAEPHHDTEAKQADDAAAAVAARAGKPIPPARALAELGELRKDADRAVGAHTAAVAAVTNDLDTVAGKAYWSTEDAEAKRRDKVRGEIEKAAHALADRVEAEIATRSSRDWMRGATYHRTAEALDLDYVPALASRGIDRDNRVIVGVRDAIVTAATTTITEEN